VKQSYSTRRSGLQCAVRYSVFIIEGDNKLGVNEWRRGFEFQICAYVSWNRKWSHYILILKDSIVMGLDWRQLLNFVQHRQKQQPIRQTSVALRSQHSTIVKEELQRFYCWLQIGLRYRTYVSISLSRMSLCVIAQATSVCHLRILWSVSKTLKVFDILVRHTIQVLVCWFHVLLKRLGHCDNLSEVRLP